MKWTRASKAPNFNADPCSGTAELATALLGVASGDRNAGAVGAVTAATGITGCAASRAIARSDTASAVRTWNENVMPVFMVLDWNAGPYLPGSAVTRAETSI